MNQNTPPALNFFGILILVATAALAALSLSYPLLGTLGSESGLLLALVAGPLLFLSGAVRGGYRDRRGFSADFTHEIGVALIAFVLFGAALSVNSFFVTSCAPA